MEITKENLGKIRKDLDKILSDYGKENGLKLSIGDISYSEIGFSTKLSGKTTEEIRGKSVEQIEFEKNCWMFNLQKEDYNKEITLRGEKYKIVGVNPKARKTGVFIQKISTGEKYRMDSESVNSKLGRK